MRGIFDIHNIFSSKLPLFSNPATFHEISAACWHVTGRRSVASHGNLIVILALTFTAKHHELNKLSCKM